MRLRTLLFASVSILLTLACDKKKEEPVSEPEIMIPAASMAVFRSGITFDSGGSEAGSGGQEQSATVRFTVTANWSTTVADVVKSSSWLSVNPAGGAAGEVTMTITAQPNTTETDRSATVTIQCGTVKESFTVNQYAAPKAVAVESITLNKNELTLEPGASEILSATVLPANAVDKTVTWSTSDAEVATVADGKVTAVKEGEAIITAKAGGKEATCKVVVKNAVVAVSSITLSKTELNLKKGDVETLVATIAPDNATDKSVIWSCDDETIASVDQAGKVTAVKSGRATVTAQAGEQTATCVVTITTPVVSVSLDRTAISLEIGQMTTVFATISPNDADEKTVTWTTSNVMVASVAGGVITAMSEGTATITATAGGKSATCVVTVEKGVVAVTSVTLNRNVLTLERGASETLVATVLPDDATDKTVTWSSSDVTIANVDQSGKVAAVKSGKATITAKAGEESATCEVTVTTPVESVSLDRNSVTLEEGQTTTLSATISPNDADEQTVSWTTSDAAVATVSNGVVTAVAEGTAVITASAGSKQATCQVTVQKAVVPVTSVTLNKSTLNLTKGQSESLVATVNPLDATDKTVTWSSSDATIASVDQSGKVTAVKSGKATITAAAGEKSATCAVTVTTPVQSVSLDRTSVTLDEGEITTLDATISPADADEQTITWTTSNAGVATVSNGVVTAVSEGIALIKASAGGKEASCTVSVQKLVLPVSSVTLSKTTLALTKGQSETLIATVAPSNATDKTVTWSSSDATIASVDQSGRVTAVKSGKVTITAEAGEKSATCEVTVTTPVESVSLDRTSVTLEEGQTTTLTATINPNDADEQTVIWTTSDARVATVSNGVVTAVSEGTVIIKASVGGKDASCTVTVQKLIVPVTSVSLNKSELTLRKGESETLTATVAPDNATDKAVTWSSSDATIASVDHSGKVTAAKSGKVTITVAAGEKSATCAVTVTTPVQSVSLDRTSVTLDEGETTTLTATINPADADEQTVTWTTSNAGVATVSNGVITAVAEGTVVIKASAGGKEASCTVTVQKLVVPVSSVKLNKSTLALAKGQSETLIATVAPDNATDKTVTWSSSDATIARVDQTGGVIAVKSGKATITAAAGEKSATCAVTVTTPVQSVSLDRTSVTLDERQTTTLTATINPNDADEQTVTWATSNAGVATVSNGVVTAVAEGTAVIKASVGGKEANCTVTVQKLVVPVTSVTLNKNELTLKKGESETLTATVAPGNATDKTVTWSSSDATIASVDQTGKVTAVKSGKATITAAAGEKSATCAVTVTTPVQSVSLDRTSVTLDEGETTTLTATINPANADEQTVTWTTSNAGVATVSNGVITAVAEGTAVIKASAGGKEASCTVIVKKLIVPVTSVVLNKSTLALTKGQSETLTATVTPDNATDKTVIWSSSDVTIARVDQLGLVTAIKSGKATITAAVGEKSTTCEVTVTTPVQSVSLDRTTVSIEKGQSITLTATINPNDADEQTVTWSSSDATIARVDQTGRVTAVKSGIAIITAQAGEEIATCGVTVTTPVHSVSLDRTSITLDEGETTILTATINPNDADEQTVTWTTSNAGVATVLNGVITAVAEGTAIIKASVGGKEANCMVIVKKLVVPVISVALSQPTLALTKGQSETLIATVTPDNATDKLVTWSSSDATIARVDQSGRVTAVKSGKATITAAAGEKSATCEVTVTTPVTSITLNKTTLELEKGKSFTLVATINPTDADEKTITWISSNVAAATVVNGVVTAVAEGFAVIMARAGGIEASCTVIVKKAEIGGDDPEGFEEGGEIQW